MIDQVDKDRIKGLFEAWEEIQERKKEIANETKGVVEEAAEILDVKKTIINKLFKELKKKQENDDELDTLTQLLLELEAGQ